MLFEAPYFPDIQGHTLPETKDRASETIKRVERAGWYPEPRHRRRSQAAPPAVSAALRPPCAPIAAHRKLGNP